MFRFVLIGFFLGTQAYAGEAFVCDKTSSVRKGQVIHSCGVGVSKKKNQAQNEALKKAHEKYSMLCNQQFDCKNYLTVVIPTWEKCEKKKGSYQCFKNLKVKITKTKNSELSNMDIQDLQVVFETLKRELSSEEKSEAVSQNDPEADRKLKSIKKRIIEEDGRIGSKEVYCGMDKGEVEKVFGKPTSKPYKFEWRYGKYGINFDKSGRVQHLERYHPKKKIIKCIQPE